MRGLSLSTASLDCPKLWDQILGEGRVTVSCQNGPGQGETGIKLTFCQILHNDSIPPIHPSAPLVKLQVKYRENVQFSFVQFERKWQHFIFIARTDDYQVLLASRLVWKRLEKFSIIWKMLKIFLSSIICLDLVLEFSLCFLLFSWKQQGLNASTNQFNAFK